MKRSVSVVIAAKNAAATIGTAISSALREPEVGRVVVVDDGSTDQTSAVAREADDGTCRVHVLSYRENSGPSFARNRGIGASDEPFIAILDADDFFLPGRFVHMFEQPNWDLIADNIAFFNEPTDIARAADLVVRFEPQPSNLDLDAFVRGNIPKRGLERSELGFLKPLIRRTFLDRHRMRYDESLRLGEDYELYTRALALQARFTVVRNCGYGAIERAVSLSSRHSTEDLRRLANVDVNLLKRPDLTPGQRQALRLHEAEIRNRFRLRYYLDLRRKNGLTTTLGKLARNPSAWRPVVAGIVSDKLANGRPKGGGRPVFEPRYLFPAEV